jgi:alpha-glucosidase (family GH31 glycosyl hydrolase)
MYSLSIEFCMLDLTNPSAVRWMKDIIKNFSITEAGSSGWMADFGEYLPFDAQLYSGQPASEYHNIYPQDWAKLNLEVLEEMNLSTENFYFMRSAWMKSPQYNAIFWEGDQLISWDEYDGLKSVITGALSSGLCGHTISHSDIGGYNVNFDYGYVRDEEILSRWSELTAFGAGLFRTHIGSSTDSRNFQVYESDSSLRHFKKFTDIYKQLRDYRKGLIDEAGESGLPLIRFVSPPSLPHLFFVSFLLIDSLPPSLSLCLSLCLSLLPSSFPHLFSSTVCLSLSLSLSIALSLLTHSDPMR